MNVAFSTLGPPTPYARVLAAGLQGRPLWQAADDKTATSANKAAQSGVQKVICSRAKAITISEPNDQGVDQNHASLESQHAVALALHCS